jgi:hypothetical protein
MVTAPHQILGSGHLIIVKSLFLNYVCLMDLSLWAVFGQLTRVNERHLLVSMDT